MFAALHIFAEVSATAALMGVVYLLIAMIGVTRFARARRKPSSRPEAVTILKPVCGLDPELYDNIASYCRQDYAAPVQIVIGAHRETDPAVSVVRRIMADFPDADIALVIDAALPGSNYKICNLVNMMSAAKHDILIVSDSDMRVEPDYLGHVVGTLQRPGVGIATTLYKARPVGGLASSLGAAFINHGFLPSVLVGKFLNAAPFCSGATIAIRRELLKRIGGFEALLNTLADDYAIGALVRAQGLTLALAKPVVENVMQERDLRTMLRHELRWQRTIRSITPLGLASSIITTPVALALLALLLDPFSPALWLLLASALAARLSLVYICNRLFKLTRYGPWLAPVREIVSAFVLVASYLGQSVVWRDSRFQIGRRGELTLEGDELA